MDLDSWVLNDRPSRRYPLYTRSNAAEVMGHPLSPLGYSFIWRGAFDPGTQDAYLGMGGFEPDELDGPGEVYGVFGGYFYLNLSCMLLVFDRMPGGDPEQLAAAFDSHPAMPAFSREAWWSNPAATARLAATSGRILAGQVPDAVREIHDLARTARAQRPDLRALTDAELTARMRAMLPIIRRGADMHATVGHSGMLAMGALESALAQIGRADSMGRLSAGAKDVETADIAAQLWSISRVVRGAPELRSTLEADGGGTTAPTGHADFDRLFARFIFDHGSRGDNEWDLLGRTFETTPRLALSLIASMAKQSDEADPATAQARVRANAADAMAEISAQLAGQPEQLAQIERHVEALGVWFAARERSKNMNIRLVHEVRMAADELARRMVERGHASSLEAFYMLLDAELEPYAADPTRLAAALAERLQTFEEVGRREPPFIVNGQCPPLSDWPIRQAAAAPMAAVGEALTGIACAPGTATGRARIIHDASDPGALEPGDILIARSTNPSWTPLFLVAGAVVTEFGLFNSHASIVSRELGVPCVVSVAGAMGRIPDGALIRVDGDTGAVEILDLPGGLQPTAAVI